MKDALAVLEFDKLKEILKEFAQTTYGKIYISSIVPNFNSETAQMETDTLEIFFESFSVNPPILEDIFIDDYLDKAQYTILDAKEIYYICKFIKFVADINASLDENLKRIVQFVNLDKLAILIFSSIDENGFVKDSATKKLLLLRNKIKQVKNEIAIGLRNYIASKGMQNILLDTNVFLKNYRFTILVKPNYNEYIKARKVDISKSGFFVEPYEIFEKNNILEDLSLEETKELQKILSAYTNLIRKNTRNLIYDTKQIAFLDAALAKFRFAKDFNAHLAQFNQNCTIQATNLKHPILIKNKSKIIANNINLRGTLIITGPNTGGKTVFIKQVGLAILSAYSGIPICADKFCVGKISNIFALIGDEQETESLSTFSSNMLRIRDIIQEFNENSLILLDEPGSGTSPDESHAIVYAIIKYLNQKNPLIIMSTHYRELVYRLKELENITLAAFEFDKTNLKPTYNLIYGKIGKSYGLEIMQNYLNNEEISSFAKDFHNSKNKALDKFEKELDLMLKKKRTYETVINRYKQLFKKLNKELELKNQQLTQEYCSLTQHYNNLIDTLKKEISNVIKTKEIKHAQRLINTLKTAQNQNTAEETSLTFKEGETVKFSRSIGKVVGFKNKNILVNIEGKILEVKPSLLQKAPHVKSDKVPITIEKAVINELNIIGKYSFEAEIELQEFLDYAVKNDIKDIRIVHGKGSGVLKELVRNILKEYKAVESFSMAPPDLGGDGATLAILK